MSLKISSKTGIEKKLFKLKSHQKDGLLLQIHYTTTVRGSQQKIRYTHVCFDCMGLLMASITHRGDMLVVDFVNNKFWTTPTHTSCSLLKFSPLNDCEVLIGGTNGQIHIFNIESSETVGVLRGHKHSIIGISFSKEYHCLSSSQFEAILWDLRTNTELQVLNLVENAVLKHICFMPVTNNILACFQDDTMQVWKYENFECFKKILPKSWNKDAIKRIAITRNGRAMVVGSHSSQLAIFLIDIWEYSKTIDLPPHIQSIRHIDFISQPFDGGANKILAILSGDGNIYFYNMEDDSIYNKLCTVQEIIRFTTSFDGKYIACVLSTGEINIYTLHQYLTKVQLVEIKSKKKISKLTPSPSSDSKKALAICKAQEEIDQILNTEKLQKILKQFGAYPDAHRIKIWMQLLKLPKNNEEYNTINQCYQKTPFENIETEYPLQNKIALKNLKKMLVNLCTWCPLFSHVQYLPVFVYPFVRVFQNEPVLCFEALCTILLNWCQHWFEYFPLPPINILMMVENIILEHDIELLRHFNKHNVTSEIYAWSLLEAAFSESLTSQYWRNLWDHILSNEPAFLLFVLVAYNTINRTTLMNFKSLDEFKFFYHNQNPIDLNKLISKSYYLLENTSENYHPRQYLLSFKGIGSKSYPMFSEFPKAVLDYENKKITELKVEDAVLKKEEGRMLQLKMLRKEEFDSLKKSEIEKERLRELEKVCKDKVKDEYNRILKERKRIARLRKQISAEETAMLALSSSKIKASCLKEKQSALENLLYKMEQSKVIDEVNVMEAETGLLKHYSELLKHRIQIEDLLDSNSSNAAPVQNHLKKQQQILSEEINKVQGQVNSKKYLKNLSIATGLAAVDNLISRVEEELDNSDKHVPTNSEKITRLQTESYELEQRVKGLLKLIEAQKSIEKPKRIGKISARKSNSLSCMNELLINVTDLNDADNLSPPDSNNDH